MKPKLIVLILALLTSYTAQAQDTVKNSNSIFYFELYGGGALTKYPGVALGYGFNYQTGKHLFTLRSIGTVEELRRKADNNLAFEWAGLYGRRYVKGGRAISFSAGVSYNFSDYENLKVPKYSLSSYEDFYWGLPYEFNITWFKSEKKSSSFGISAGLKVAGNISKNSFISGGIVLGFGSHKHY